MAKAKKTKKKYADLPPGVTPYYLSISKALGRAKWVTVFLLVAALLACAVFARNEISLYNFRYLMKHFDINSEDNAGNFSTLRYEDNAAYAFGYYKDDLILASSTGVDFYDMRGNIVLSGTHAMSQPSLVSTDRYLYLYDQGGYTYSVYDSFFCIRTETLDYPISLIKASGSGVFAIVTRTVEYRSAVYIYDQNFRERSQIFKDKLIMDVNISADGSRVLALSLETDEQGAFFTEIQSVEPGKSDPVFTVTVEDCYPVQAAYFSDGGVGVLASDRYLAYDKDGTLLSEHRFAGQTPTACAFADNYAAVSFNQSVIGAKSTLYFYASDGSLSGPFSIDGQVKKLRGENGYVYALLTDAVARMKTDGSRTLYEYTEHNPLDFLVRDEQSILICYANRTQSVVYAFSAVNEEETNDDNPVD